VKTLQDVEDLVFVAVICRVHAVKIRHKRVMRISIVRSHCQGTAGEDTEGWKNAYPVLW
jgi:hypothetical protein